MSCNHKRNLIVTGIGVHCADCLFLELPHETFERVVGMKWPGGNSLVIRWLLRVHQITAPPGTAEANLQLQEILFK